MKMNMKLNSGRILWIDAAKGIGLLCVILGHLGVPYLSTLVYTFHMPLFFFLSGIVFSGSKYSPAEFLKRKLKSLVLPYFTLGGVIFAFFSLVYALQHQPGQAYLAMLKDFLVQEHFWTVWFLACLFLTEVLYYLIHRLFGKKPLYSTVLSALVCIVGLARYRLGWGSLPWNLDVALVAQFFFHAGYLSREHLLRGEEKPTAPCLRMVQAAVLMGINAVAGFLCIRVSGSSLDMSVGLYGNELLTFVSALAGTLAVILVAKIFPLKPLTYLGSHTMVIFAWHSRIVIVACDYLYADLGLFSGGTMADSLLRAAVTFVVILGLLIPATELLKRSRCRRLFGL